MARRTERVRMYEDEKALVEEVREERYDRPEDVPLGQVVADVMRDYQIHLNGDD